MTWGIGLGVMGIQLAHEAVAKLGHKIEFTLPNPSSGFSIQCKEGCSIQCVSWLGSDMFKLNINMFQVPPNKEDWKKMPCIWCPRLRALL